MHAAEIAMRGLSHDSAMKLLMIDNYDSFTYNLAQYFGELGADVVTVRNDAYSVDDALAGRMPGLDGQAPQAIVVSPGPCSPDRGRYLGRVDSCGRHHEEPYAAAGVCLGHQSIGQAFGGKVVRAKPSCMARHPSSRTPIRAF